MSDTSRRGRPLHAAALALLLLSYVWIARAAAESVEHPLEPAVTSSPRETFQTFLASQEATWTLVRDAGSGRRSADGFEKLMELDARTKRTFDLSEFAPEARDETANDAVVFLYEVLMRLELPPLSEIPGDAEIEEGLDLESWTLPHTEITVHRVFEGPRQGEYLFSPDTVERAEEFYERVKLLPYKTSPPIEHVSQFLEVYGGWAIPLSWVDALPAWMRNVLAEQAVWKWMALFSTIVFFLAALLGLHRVTRGREEPRSAARYLSRLSVPALMFVASFVGIPGLASAILLTGDVAKYVNLATSAIAYLSLAWMVWTLILAAAEWLVSRPRVRAESLDASLIRLTARLIAIAAVVVLVFQGATAVGIPLVGLVASVSIGGLAVALAAQDTLKNLLGSLMIFIDQPYRVGERIVAGSHDGVVETIGLRSTRIRQLDGHLTAIPNEKMATTNIENVERRQYIRRKTNLRIAIGTPREKIEQAVALVGDALRDHEGMPADRPPRVYFHEFDPDSLKIVIFCWYAPPDYWAFCEFSERVNLEIVRRLAEAGIELVPPTSTTKLLRDSSESPEPEAS